MKMTDNDDSDDNHNSFYVRCYSFGEKQFYNPNQLIKLGETLVISFAGKQGEIKKSLTYPKSEESLIGIIRLGEKFMKKEYSTYTGQDIVEGLEISHKPDRTLIHFYLPFALNEKIIIGGNEMDLEEFLKRK
jgi:hypothetical protein